MALIKVADLGISSGVSTPAFEARLTTAQNVSHNTKTKVQLNQTDVNIGNCWDGTTNYRFTPNVAGYYLFNFGLRGYAGGSSSSDHVRFISISPYKNGSEEGEYYGDDTDAFEQRLSSHKISKILYLNGSSDYVEFYGKVYAENLSSTGVQFYHSQSFFNGHKLIGV